jgi:hypothetical protein
MGAPNFITENANCVYAVDTNAYDENGNIIEDYFIGETIYEEVVEETNNRLKKVAKENKWFYEEDEESYDNDRNYPAKKIGRLIGNFYFWGYEVEVVIIPYARSGYYTGFNLDYGTEIYVDGEDVNPYGEWDFENIKKAFEDVLYYYGREKEIGLFKYNFHKCEKKITDLIWKMKEKVEEVYKEVSTSLQTFAKFSNGETWYAPCSA